MISLMQATLSHDCILTGRLYLGAFPHEHHGDVLARLGIQGILTILDDDDPRDLPPDLRRRFEWARVPVRDGLLGGVPSTRDLADAVGVLRDWERAGIRTSYVHCWYGMGRSPLVVMAHLATGSGDREKMSLSEAIAWVRQHRPEANPSARQMMALSEYLHATVSDPRFNPATYEVSHRVVRG